MVKALKRLKVNALIKSKFSQRCGVLNVFEN
jgi:hypothetical protein